MNDLNYLINKSTSLKITKPKPPPESANLTEFFDEECLEKRLELRRAKNQERRHPNCIHIREKRLSILYQYKSLLQQKKELFETKIAERENALGEKIKTTPHDFWELRRRLKDLAKADESTLMPSKSELLMFFREVFHDPNHQQVSNHKFEQSDRQSLDEPFSATEVEQQIWASNSHSAPGIDNINYACLKEEGCKKWHYKFLAILFTKIYNTGVYPTDWKTALLVPVHKKGEREISKNYRPISLLSVF